MRFQAVLIGILLSVTMGSAALAQSRSDVERSRTDCEADDAYACWQLGMAYEMGTHVPADNVEAMRWFRRAAELGSPDAHMSLGVMSYHGHGVPQDFSEAFRWYDAAFQLGFEGARLALADMYATGRGVEQNTEMAIELLEVAVANGNTQVQRYLERLQSQSANDFIVVPLAELIANGAAYNGQVVMTEGFLTLEDYGKALFVSENDYTNSNYAQSIPIMTSVEMIDTRERLERTHVRFRGRYDHTCAQPTYFCSAHPGQGILEGGMPAFVNGPDDGHLPAHYGLMETVYREMDVSNVEWEHHEGLVQFGRSILDAFTTGEEASIRSLFPVAANETLSGGIQTAGSRPHFVFYDQRVGLVPFVNSIEGDLAFVPYRFPDDLIEPTVAAICFQQFTEPLDIPEINSESVMYGSYHDPYRCLPTVLDNGGEWKIDPSIVASHVDQEDFGGNYDFGEDEQSEATIYTHVTTPEFHFLNRMRERPRPRSVVAMRDGVFDLPVYYVTPSDAIWALERLDGQTSIRFVQQAE